MSTSDMPYTYRPLDSPQNGKIRTRLLTLQPGRFGDDIHVTLREVSLPLGTLSPTEGGRFSTEDAIQRRADYQRILEELPDALSGEGHGSDSDQPGASQQERRGDFQAWTDSRILAQVCMMRHSPTSGAPLKSVTHHRTHTRLVRAYHS